MPLFITTRLPALASFTFVAACLASFATAPQAQVLEPGSDATIRDQLCLGQSCANDPSPNFIDQFAASLMLHDTRTRIDFVDTSNATFPSVDWSLVTNDVTSLAGGGTNHFSIQNATAATTPFRISASAPENALYVDDFGLIGFGTSLPQADLHTTSNQSAKLRMQNTSGGDWTVSVGSTGFGLFNNASFPFLVENSAPGNSFWMKQSGDVGLGTNAPSAALHLRRTDGGASMVVENAAIGPSGIREMFKMTNNGGSYFTLDNTNAGTTWFFVHEDAAPNRFIITDGVADGPEMTVTADGDLTIQGRLFTAGSCAAGCDRVFDADYDLPTIGQQAAMMHEMRHLPAVGPTPEDGPFNITAMTGGMLNELEKAHLYIAELNDRDRDMERQLAAQSREIAELRALIYALR